MSYARLLAATSSLDYSKVAYTAQDVHRLLEDLWNTSPNRFALYLRGSFSNSKGHNPLDIDVYYVLDGGDPNSYSAFAIAQEFEKKYPTLPYLDLSTMLKQDLLHREKKLMTKLILLNEGQLVFGEDISGQIDDVALDDECASSISVKQSLIVQRKLTQARQFLKDHPNESTASCEYTSLSISKATLRLITGSLIRSRRMFVRDVSICYREILAQHPALAHHASLMIDRIHGKHFALWDFMTAACALYNNLRAR